MKKITALILIIILGSVCLAYGQSGTDVYLAVRKAELKANGLQEEFDRAMANAWKDLDLFKNSKEAKENPKFTEYIENAMVALREAQFVAKNPGDWKKCMDRADKELDKAKKSLK